MIKRALRVIGATVATATGLYVSYVAITYVRFGATSREPSPNPLLDRLMPEFDVRERHHTSVAAPVDITLAAAREISFHDSPIVRAIFALRALPGRLTGAPAAPTQRRQFFDEVIALGWRPLAEMPGRQVVMGAVTQPWKQEVRFHGLPADEFTTFAEPGYAKIAWMLEVEPLGPSSSVFRTETRVVTTDPLSREQFRRYWSFLSPGILIIRYETLRLVRAEAERRYRSRRGV